TNLQGSTANAGANTLTGPNLANTWSITASNTGSVAGVNFVGVQNLTGGTNTDSFTLSGTGNISGTITGGGAATGNTLTSNGITSTWTVNALNGGTLVDANGTN